MVFVFSHGIALEAQWILRSLNGRADFLSRFVDKDDWRVNPSVFRLVDARPFFMVAPNSECWLCVWILGEFLVPSRIVF